MLTELVIDRVYVFNAPTNSGVIVNPSEKRALMLDSGLDDSQARKVYRQINEELNAELTDVLTTHAHADHFGGHHWLQKKGVRLHASAFEKAWVENPIMMSYGLFGGVRPPTDLQNKFLKASTASIDHICEESDNYGESNDLSTAPFDLTLLALPGHSLGQIGAISEGVFFSGDALFTPEVLEKHNHLPYNVDIAQVRYSLEKIKTAVAKYNVTHLVPGHGPVLNSKEDLHDAISQYYRILDDNMQEVKQILTDHGGKAGGEEILSAMLKSRDATHMGKDLFSLYRATVNANLVYLEEQDELISYIESGKLVYSLKKL